jgi:GTP-binding protein Era
VAIISSRPQTTRNTIRGVVHREDAQVILVDSPGLHKPRTELGERLNRLVYGTLADADAVLFVLDAGAPIGPGDRRIAQRLTDVGSKTVVALNKIDTASKSQITSQLATAGAWDFAAYVPISALKGDGVGAVLDELVALLDDGPAFYPETMFTDQPESQVIAEIVREKYLSRLHEELPHSLTVTTDEVEVRANGTTYISARIIVERESQKPIVIGAKGELLRTVGQEAREDLEKLLATPVYLDLRVKVEKGWQDRPQLLDRLGF